MPYKDPAVRKLKHAEYSKKHYEENKVSEKIRLAKTKKERRAEWIAFKATLRCQKCGEDHPATFDFHHVNPEEKENDLSTLINSGLFAKAHKELKKCIVLCSNCHRIHHYEENLKLKNPAL